MITVQAASRLHFGLLSLPAELDWPNQLGQAAFPARRFGGVGLMIQSPGLTVRIQPSKEWSARGPLAERVSAFARCFLNYSPIDSDVCSPTLRELALPPQEIIVEQCAPEHAGLGTGTQLGLAVARGLVEAWNLPVHAGDLCRRVGRGRRSSLGFHGFFQGGFLVEAGKTSDSDISPLVVREPFPEDWRIVLITPPGKPGRHGFEESEAFQQLLTQGMPLRQIESLCRLTLLQLLPALVERDFKNFSEGLFEFNNLAGQAFVKVQGGTYANPLIAEFIQFIRRQGFAGVGQSSWGPAVFALAENESAAQDLVCLIRGAFNLHDNDILVTTACNHGAKVIRQ
jgi:beta-ribofuranosylaminobenzene 5'-phosphate synthase